MRAKGDRKCGSSSKESIASLVKLDSATAVSIQPQAQFALESHQETCENLRMNSLVTKRRMIVDAVLVCIFGLAVPPFLAPFSRSWSMQFAAGVTFFLATVFLWDGLRTWQRFRNPHSN